MKQNRIIKSISTPGTLSIAIGFGMLALLFATSFSRQATPDISNFLVYARLSEWLSHTEWEGFTAILLVNILTVALLVWLLFRINEKYSFIRVRTVMPCFIFVFLLITSRTSLVFFSGLWASFFLLLALWRLMSAYQEKNPARNIFDVFFLLAAGSFFSFELFLLIPVFWFSFPFFRITSFRTFMASVIGLATSYILLTAILLLLGVLPDFWDSVIRQFDIFFSFSGISPRLIVYMVFLFLLFLLSLVGFFLQTNKDKIRVKQTYFFFFLLTFFLFFISVVRIQIFFQIFPLLAFMLSITAGHYFTLNESRFSFFWFILFMLGGVTFFVLNR